MTKCARDTQLAKTSIIIGTPFHRLTVFCFAFGTRIAMSILTIGVLLGTVSILLPIPAYWYSILVVFMQIITTLPACTLLIHPVYADELLPLRWIHSIVDRLVERLQLIETVELLLGRIVWNLTTWNMMMPITRHMVHIIFHFNSS